MPATRTGAATSADSPDAFWDEPDEEDDELEPAADHAGAARSAAGAAVLGASFGGPAAVTVATRAHDYFSSLHWGLASTTAPPLAERARPAPL